MGRRINSAVWMEKHKRWQIKVQKDGMRRTFYSSSPGRKGQRECNAKADAWLDEGIEKTDTKSQALWDQWLQELKETTSRSHWTQYSSYWDNWINPRIGKTPIASVSEQRLQDVVNAAHKKNLSDKTLRNIRACMTAFIKYCRKCNVTKLIVENVYIPKGAPVGERTILQPDDLLKLFQSDLTLYRGQPKPEPYINAYRFETSTGLRPGEIIGMKWDDIKNNAISLKRSINEHNEITKGKNNNARRTFKLKPIDLDILNDQRIYLSQSRIISEYVFPNVNGDHINQCTYRRHWNTYCDYNKVSCTSPYELRHTFISINKELPEGLLKPLVGHSVDMDTYKTYSHEVTGDMERAAELVQKRFKEIISE